MKKLYWLSLFVLLFGCYHQENKEPLMCIQLLNRNGFSETIGSQEKLSTFASIDFHSPQPYSQVLRIYKKNAEGKTPSILTTYHPNSLVHQSLEIIDGRASGSYSEWHPNGQKKIEARVVGGAADISFFSQKDWLFDGLCKSWDERGSLLSEIPYEKGSLEGISVYYFPNGKVQKKIYYSQNELDGNWVEFFENGSLALQTSYVKGKKEGISLGFWENQKPSFFEEYENDLLKKGEYFLPSSEKIGGIKEKKGFRVVFQKAGGYDLLEYLEGKKEGKVESYNAKNEKTRLFHVKGELMEGEEILYWPKQEKKEELVPKIALFWEEGMVQGTVKSWYEDGALESQREFRQNKKNGPCTSWYPNGSLMMVEEYEEDLLQEGKYFKPHQNKAISSIVKGEGEATLFDKEGRFLKKIRYHKGKPQDS